MMQLPVMHHLNCTVSAACRLSVCIGGKGGVCGKQFYWCAEYDCVVLKNFHQATELYLFVKIYTCNISWKIIGKG